jgi:hypothetical protein
MNLDLDLSGPQLSDEELLMLLTQRVATLLEQEPDLLMSLLYRMDVEEKAIHHALLPGTDVSAAVALAKLVLERQKQRWAIKKNTAVGDEGIPDGWEW